MNRVNKMSEYIGDQPQHKIKLPASEASMQIKSSASEATRLNNMEPHSTSPTQGLHYHPMMWRSSTRKSPSKAWKLQKNEKGIFLISDEKGNNADTFRKKRLALKIYKTVLPWYLKNIGLDDSLGAGNRQATKVFDLLNIFYGTLLPSILVDFSLLSYSLAWPSLKKRSKLN